MNRSTIFTFIFLVLLGVIGYTWYRYLGESGEPPQARQESFAKSLAEVRRLKNLQLDTALFQDRFFRDLEEPELPPEPEITPGRENPFAPFR